MGHKIFVSYKYADNNVQSLNGTKDTTVRDYVDELEEKLKELNHIYKGEENDEDLSALEDDTIWEKLKERIWDSTLTIVMFSPEMRESNKKDRDQWIPWEVSYSLKETQRKNKEHQAVTSKSNAMLAIVLPDADGSYSYYLESHNCCVSPCVTHYKSKLFKILKENKFNLKEKNQRKCDKETGKKIHIGECSYISAVKWENFMNNPQKYIDSAYKRQENIDDYEIRKEL